MNIVVIARVIPYPGIDHAGGEYLRRHVAALVALGHEVMVIAPEEPRNLDALQRVDSSISTHLIPDSRYGGGPLCRFVSALMNRLGWLLTPWSARWSLRAGAAGDSEYHQLLASADIVDIQWTEMVQICPSGLLGDTTSTLLTVTAHDILSQREHRHAVKMTGSSFVGKFRRKLSARLAFRFERRVFNRADAVYLLSKKDVDLAKAISPKAHLRELFAPLWPVPEQGSDVVKLDHSVDVLIVGAWQRPENVEGVTWFLKEVWHQVLASHPSANLYLVGSSPPPSLAALAQTAEGVVLTGYVDSIEPYYDLARAVAVPLFRGAGVKFKTVDALLRGVPIVTTVVGAEGIAEQSQIQPFTVTDNYREFSQAIIRILDGDAELLGLAERATGWAREYYGLPRFESELEKAIDSVVRSP